ncbi:hypothetical protein ACFFRR_008841 [Megaselia abdita]
MDQQFNAQIDKQSTSDVIQNIKREVMQEIRKSPQFCSRNRIIVKTPLIDTFDEFQELETNLLNPDFNKRMVEELRRFRGMCVQSSLSTMLYQLFSKTLLKQFCFKGSSGRNSSGIQKRPFKTTLSYVMITGNFLPFSFLIYFFAFISQKLFSSHLS